MSLPVIVTDASGKVIMRDPILRIDDLVLKFPEHKEKLLNLYYCYNGVLYRRRVILNRYRGFENRAERVQMFAEKNPEETQKWISEKQTSSTEERPIKLNANNVFPDCDESMELDHELDAFCVHIKSLVDNLIDCWLNMLGKVHKNNQHWSLSEYLVLKDPLIRRYPQFEFLRQEKTGWLNEVISLRDKAIHRIAERRSFGLTFVKHWVIYPSRIETSSNVLISKTEDFPEDHSITVNRIFPMVYPMLDHSLTIFEEFFSTLAPKKVVHS